MDSKKEPYDVILKVGSVDFPCHRRILAECSPYFQAMFSSNFIERDKGCIQIQGVDPDAMAMLIDSVYKKEVDLLKSDDILSVLQASYMLQFESVQKTCTELIVHQWLTTSTCLQTMVTTDEVGVTTLYQKAKALALWEFSQIKETEAFLELTIDHLEKYLKNDSLNITEGEMEVFESAISWLHDKPLERKMYTKRILECIRFSALSTSDIKTMLLFSIFNESLECLQTLQCIICIKEGKEPKEINSELQSFSSGSSQTVDDRGVEVSQQKRAKKCNCADLESHKKQHSILNNYCSCCTSKPLAPIDEIEVHGAEEREQDAFSAETIATTKQLLGLPYRTLPMVPCVIGHTADSTQSIIKGSNDKNRKTINDSGKPYIIYFQEGKTHQPLPLLHLSKVSQGPLEPTGYKVVNRGQDLYVIGGEYLLGYGNWNKSIWKYDIIREVWNYETSISHPRRHHSVCCLGDYMYVIGGFGQHRVIMDSVEKYNVRTRTWYHCASLPQNIYSAACCTFKGLIFVFGPQVYFYHPDVDNWSVLSEVLLPSNAVFSSALPSGEWIYLTGTYSKELVRFAPQLSFPSGDKSTSRFESLGSFSHNTSNTCLVNNVIYSFSTDDSDKMYVESYCVEQKKFSILWSSTTGESSDIADFSPKHCIGCFPLIKY